MRLRIATVSLCFALASVPFAPDAAASRGDTRSEARSSASQSRSSATQRARSDFGGISCVPYARSVTGMDISGNGRDWWYSAAGRYARGQRPRAGSILAWPGSGGMRSGHVAVVSRVLNNRLIEIDHANWGGPGIRRGTVMRNVKVVDVSEDNSWTRVRVQVGWTAENFGREYPTYGFIHNAPPSSFAAADEMMRPVAFSAPRATTGANTGARRPATSHARPAARNAHARAITTPVRVAQAQQRPR